MNSPCREWAAAAAICAGLFIFIDHVVMRRTLPVLFAGFIIGRLWRGC